MVKIAKNKKNSAAIGIVGRIRDSIENLFLDETGAQYIQYDQYPFRRADVVDVYYILGLQVASKIAKERNVEFYFVTQTYGQTDNITNPRMLSQEDLYWLNNMLVGFGIKQISYFTYWTPGDDPVWHFRTHSSEVVSSPAGLRLPCTKMASSLGIFPGSRVFITAFLYKKCSIFYTKCQYPIPPFLSRNPFFLSIWFT